MRFFQLVFVHLSTEVDGGLGTDTQTQTHTHTQTIPYSCTHKHTCAHLSRVPGIRHIRTHGSNHRGLIYLHCIFLCSYVVSDVMLSLFFPFGICCPLLFYHGLSLQQPFTVPPTDHQKNKEEMDGQRRREGERRVQEGVKTGKEREAKKGEN